MAGIGLAQLIDLVVGGLAIGCVYSLVALGFAMIMRATSIIHFAQGEVGRCCGCMCGLPSEAFVVGDLVFAASQLASNFKRGVPVEARKRIVSSITARTSSCRRSTFWRT